MTFGQLKDMKLPPLEIVKQQYLELCKKHESTYSSSFV